MRCIEKISNSNYFRIRSNIFIDRGLMNLLTLFFGLLGIPNFITKRYSQGAVHLILLLLASIGILIPRDYPVSVSWGPILITINYALAFLETKTYNWQVDAIKKQSPCATNSNGQESSATQYKNIIIVNKPDINYLISGYTSIILSLAVAFIELPIIYLSIGSLSANQNMALSGVFIIIIEITIVTLFFSSVYNLKKYLIQFKQDLLKINKFKTKHQVISRIANILFWCDVALIACVVLIFAYTNITSP